MAPAAQEQAATLNQVVEHTTDLAEHADELEESLSRFDVRSAGMGTDRDSRVDRGRSGGHSHEGAGSANTRTGTRSTSSTNEFEFERDEKTAETGPHASGDRSTDADGMEWQSLATDGGDE